MVPATKESLGQGTCSAWNFKRNFIKGFFPSANQAFFQPERVFMYLIVGDMHSIFTGVASTIMVNSFWSQST